MEWDCGYYGAGRGCGKGFYGGAVVGTMMAALARHLRTFVDEGGDFGQNGQPLEMYRFQMLFCKNEATQLR